MNGYLVSDGEDVFSFQKELSEDDLAEWKRDRSYRIIKVENNEFSILTTIDVRGHQSWRKAECFS